MNIKSLVETIEKLFSNRGTLVSVWQELAENFYPERADFTAKRDMGDNYADNLTTSFPVRCRRDLGDQFGAMLRPRSKSWFHMKPIDEDRIDNDASRWLEWAEDAQRRAMYDRSSQFTRATKEGDHDFATFGQTVLSVRLNRYGNGLLYRCWHLRDVVWMENEDGEINLIARKWKPYAKDLKALFGDKCHSNVTQKVEKEPFAEIECYHIIVESEMYDGKGNKPYFSIYYDKANEHIMEEVGVFNKEYVIPRWQTVSGSQYAYSPASIVALPDARMIQAMTYTLLEAGEKATNPPLIATRDAVRSDISIYAGGVTWVDQEYDERLGASLKPIEQDLRGLPVGMEMVRDSNALLAEIFYLNKLGLPDRGGPEMTAYETGQRVQEYIRGAIPIFEPMEVDYNGQICETTFDVMMRAGAYGPPQSMPKSLQGADIQFHFESPLHDAIEAQHGQKFLEMKELISQAIELDQGAMSIPDIKMALRKALKGIGVPSDWINSEMMAQQIHDEQVQAKADQAMLDQAEQGANVVEKVGKVAA